MRISAKNLERKVRLRHSAHSPALATYETYSLGGEKLFQLETYNTGVMDAAGQSVCKIQFDRTTAEKLVTILKQEFGI
ncbi:MAG: hypothetical protein LBM77_12860 [Spirochaetaceae bacterium]|jgi:hypothetical protein|nr:hypothetical protein [Spirochaetaceae bacterium]